MAKASSALNSNTFWPTNCVRASSQLISRPDAGADRRRNGRQLDGGEQRVPGRAGPHQAEFAPLQVERGA
jgi:hypothetical protein